MRIIKIEICLNGCYKLYPVYPCFHLFEIHNQNAKENVGIFILHLLIFLMFANIE